MPNDVTTALAAAESAAASATTAANAADFAANVIGPIGGDEAVAYLVGDGATKVALDGRYARGTSVISAGAVADGTTDSTNAFLAVDGPGYVPDGEYVVNTDTVPLGKFRGPGIVRKAGEVGRMLGDGEDVFARRVVHELPLRFPGYSTVIAAKGYDFLFPQAFTIHEARIYVLYGGGSNAGGNLGSWVSVHNAATGAFVSGFSLPDAQYGEGIVVTRTGGNLYLYAMVPGNSIGRFDITTTPANQATLSAPTVFPVGVQSAFTYDGDKFTVQTRGDAVTGVRHKFTRYNGDLTTFNSYLNFDPADMWPITPDLIALNNKTQGLCAFRGGYAVIYGATHYDGGSLAPDKRPGIRLFTDSGDKYASGIMDPDTFIDALRDAGCTVALIEGEGIAEFKGGLYGMWVTQSHTYTGTHGIVITQELVGDIDCRKAARRGTLAKVAGHNGRVASSSTGIKNPLTGATFGTLTDVLEFMRDTETNRYGFHTTGSTIPDVAGVELPTGCLVEIVTGNFFTWRVSLFGSDRRIEWLVSGAEGALVQAEHVRDYSGTGNPEGAITAPPGSVYRNRSGGAGVTLYVKETGTGNTGWVAK